MRGGRRRPHLFNVGTATGASEIHQQGHISDSWELDEVTRDGDLDMVMHFKPTSSGLKVGDTSSCLKGKYTATDGSRYTFLGCDSVRVRK